MNTPEPKPPARLITKDDQPVFPCWVYSPVNGSYGALWCHFSKDPSPGESWTKIGWTHWTHWRPDQPAAPTCAPGAEGRLPKEDNPKPSRKRYATVEAMQRDLNRATSLPTAETGTTETEGLRNKCLSLSDHEAADEYHALRRRLERERDEAKGVALARLTQLKYVQAELAEARSELAREKGQWEIEARNAGRLLQELAEARSEVTKLGHITLGLGQEKVRLLAEVEQMKAEEEAAMKQFPCRTTTKAYLANAKERDSLRAQLTTLRAQADAMAGALDRANEMHLGRCGSSEPLSAKDYRDHACKAHNIILAALSAYHATAKPTQSSQNES